MKAITIHNVMPQDYCAKGTCVFTVHHLGVWNRALLFVMSFFRFRVSFFASVFATKFVVVGNGTRWSRADGVPLSEDMQKSISAEWKAWGVRHSVTLL